MTKIFKKYNQCEGENFVNFEEKIAKGSFNLTIRPGIQQASLEIKNSISSGRDAKFDSEIGLRIGLEAEYIMPFNKNKWSISIEPTYQSYQSEKQLETRSVMVDYKSLDLPISIRHYFFLNDNSKIFINGSYVINIPFSSVINFNPGSELEINSRGNLALGLGYMYKKYSLELRYGLNREVLSDFILWYSDYKSLSLNFGYRIF